MSNQRISSPRSTGQSGVRLVAVVATLAFATAACTLGGTATSTTGTPTTAPPSTTTSTTSTTIATTTTTPEPTSTTQPSHYGPEWYWPEQQSGAGGAEGSGCTPGSEALPDGYWFGMLIDYSDGAIVFDLACWFSDSTAPNGYRIENDNSTLRTLAVAGGAIVWHIQGDISEGVMVELPFGEWVPEDVTYLICPGEGCLVWVRVEDGEAAEVVEQYVP